MLGEFEEIEIAAEAEDVPSAVKAVQKMKPDVVFLDIQMPGDSGFELLNKVDADFKIIFVTAYDEYAIRAFDINALDYLLKPINPERLEQSIERLRSGESKFTGDQRKLDYEDKLFLTINNSLKFLKVGSIISISAAGDYSDISTIEGKKGLALKSMKEWEARLPEKYFCRIHRSTIINMEYVERLEEWFNNSLRVYLKNIKDPFVISRRYVTKIKEKLG